jgi:hypothetical protein
MITLAKPAQNVTRAENTGRPPWPLAARASAMLEISYPIGNTAFLKARRNHAGHGD